MGDEIGENGEGLCGSPGCMAAVTHDRDVWYGDGPSLRVDYFCPAHAPPDATPIDYDPHPGGGPPAAGR